MPSRVALITFLDNGAGIDNTLPSPPNYPSQGLPNYPSNELPRPPGSIGLLPVFPFDPTHPIAPGGEEPDNSLPGNPARPSHPIAIHPGLKLVVVFLACYGYILVPDNTLPPSPQPK